MRTVAQKQNASQQRSFFNPTRSSAVEHVVIHKVDEYAEDFASTASNQFAHDFSRVQVSARAQATIQPKLAVNHPGDIYEQEADSVSEQVMSMTEPQLQRACSCGGECPSCRNGYAAHERLQTKHVQASDIREMVVPPVVDEVIRSSGQPIDPTTQRHMESRFGHDFSQVRVHTDARAAESANVLRAQAYTVGHHIAFGAGQYRPDLKGGRQLLAHELTHTLQQRASTKLNGASRSYPGLHVGPLLFLPSLQRQAKPDDDPVVKTGTPSSRALELLRKFGKAKATYIRISSSDFKTEYDDKKNAIETVTGAKMPNLNRNWTYIFVTFTRGETQCIYVSEIMDDTQVGNYYKKCTTASVTPIIAWNVQTSNNIFKKGTGKFDFGSASFSNFYEDVDKGFKDIPDIAHRLILITIEGENNLVNLERASAIKDDLIKRGVNKNRISIRFGGSAGSSLILIQSNDLD